MTETKNIGNQGIMEEGIMEEYRQLMEMVPFYHLRAAYIAKKNGMPVLAKTAAESSFNSDMRDGFYLSAVRTVKEFGLTAKPTDMRELGRKIIPIL